MSEESFFCSWCPSDDDEEEEEEDGVGDFGGAASVAASAGEGSAPESTIKIT